VEMPLKSRKVVQRDDDATSPATINRAASATSLRSDSESEADTDVELHEKDRQQAPDTEKGSSLATHSSGENKLKKLMKRLFFGTILICSFFAIISLGHLATLLLVFCVQILMFRELVTVRYNYERNRHKVPLFRTTQWGWFYTCMFYSYGHAFYSEQIFSTVRSRTLLQLLPYVELISLCLYSAMLMTFVFTLKKGYYKYQVSQLAWTIAAIVITVVQVNSFTQNIFSGLFWFVYPAGLVVCNDSMAYFSGLALGRTLIRRQFSSISPNKTWEGFIGGGICTVLFAAVFPLILVRFRFLICPCERLVGSVFAVQCITPKVFQPITIVLPPWLGWSVTVLPIQLHGLALGAFASIVAPFGGLFASGIKRAYKAKDFSSLIPGHGGVFDRVDCQLIMGLATHIYFSTFIGASAIISRRRILQLASTLLPEEQLLLHRELGAELKLQGLLH